LAEQVSARTVSQATHVAPAVPQVPNARVLHVAPSQQPSGHDVESQTHCPARQRWPVVHAALPPHVQAPAVHPSAALVLHAVHAPAAVPHVVTDAEWHVSPEQQPSGHTQPLHTPPLHCSVAPQGAQALPPLPQAEVASPVWHVVPLQHPLHEEVSQTHLPSMQRCPVVHASADPQRHVPSAVQLSLVVAEHPVQMQTPALQDRPGGQAGPLPHFAPSWLWL
jgi:hypothetical protein